MSNDLTIFNGARPAHLRDVRADESTRQLAGGSGNNGLRISIKGSVWRMMSGGQQISINENRTMNVIIVNNAPHNARTFYPGTYVEGENKAPTCWSHDGKMPDPAVLNKQSASCLTCPQNAKGSGQGDAKACRYSRTLAVMLENDPEQRIFSLTLPAQSIFGKPDSGTAHAPLEAYIRNLVVYDTRYTAVVTEMKFDPSSATPKVVFKTVRWCSDDEFQLAERLKQTPEAQAIVKATVYQQDTAKQLALPGKPPAPVEEAAPAAATLKPIKAEGQSVEDLQKKMAEMMAQMEAMTKAAEPEVVKSKKAAAPPPPSKGAASLLANWEAEGE